MKISTDQLIPGMVEEHGRNVYQIYIDCENYRVTSLYFQQEDGGVIDWIYNFPQYEEMPLSLPENITQTISALDAYNKVSLTLPRLCMLIGDSLDS